MAELSAGVSNITALLSLQIKFRRWRRRRNARSTLCIHHTSVNVHKPENNESNGFIISLHDGSRAPFTLLKWAKHPSDSKWNDTEYTTFQNIYWLHKPSAEWWKRWRCERDAMNLTFLGPLKIFLLPSLAFSWALTWGFLTVSEGKGTSGNSKGSVKPQANISHVPAKWKVH